MDEAGSRQERKERTRDAILTAALDLASDGGGLAGLSLRSVAKNLLRNHLSHCATHAMHGDKAQQAAMGALAKGLPGEPVLARSRTPC